MAAAPSRIWSVRLPVGDSRERLRTLLLDESLANAAFQSSSRLLDTVQYHTNFTVWVLAPMYSGMSVSRTLLARTVPSIVTRVPKSGQLSVTGSPSPLPHKRLLLALIGGEGWSVSSSAIEGRAGVSEANRTGIIGDKRRVEGRNRPLVRDSRFHETNIQRNISLAEYTHGPE